MTFALLRVGMPASDIVAESQATYEQLDRELRGRGLAMHDVVRMRMLFTGQGDLAQMNTVREPMFREIFADGQFPSTAGFVTGPRGGAARFEMEVLAHAAKRTGCSDEVVLRYGGKRAPFVHVTEAGGVAFVSGQTAYEPDGTFVPRSPGAQAEKVLGTIAPILAEVDRTVSDLMSVSLFVGPAARGDAFADVRSAVDAFVATIDSPAPVVTCVGVENLVFDGAAVGVEAVAGGRGGDRCVSADSTAARAGELLVASAVGDGVESAIARLRAGVGELTDAVEPGALVTAWYAAPLTRADVQDVVGPALADLVPDCVVTPVPIHSAAGEPHGAVLELYASV